MQPLLKKIILPIFCMSVLLLVADTFAVAQVLPTIDDLQRKITSKTEELEKLKPVIKELEKSIDNAATKKKTLGTEIKTLDLTKKKLETDLKITQTKVDTTDLIIRKLDSEISYKENEVEARTLSLKEALLSIYESDEQTLAQIALSNEGFSSFWNDIEALEEYSDNIYKNIAQIKLIKKELEDKNNKQITEKRKLLGLKGELGERKKITEQNKIEKAQLLKLTSNQETEYQKTLKKKVALMEALEKEIQDYESTLKFILDPTSIPARGTKVFASPLDNLFITQNFGKTTASARLYASGAHNGTDFRASVGTQVRAMQSGVVAGVGDTDTACPRASFGKWVLIRYNNGLASVYGHMSLVTAKEGQVVSQGEVVGYSGNTGYSTGPHLHVSVYASAGVNVESRPSKSCGGRMYRLPLAAFSAYLDPMDYM